MTTGSLLCRRMPFQDDHKKGQSLGGQSFGFASSFVWRACFSVISYLFESKEQVMAIKIFNLSFGFGSVSAMKFQSQNLCLLKPA